MKWRLTRWALPMVAAWGFSAPELCRAESSAPSTTDASSTELHARELAKQAKAAARAGRPSDAAGLFRHAWRLHKDWDYICNVASLEVQLGRHAAAAASLTTCDRVMPDDLRTSLGAKVARDLKSVLLHVTSISIEGNVSGAEVLVDGWVADTLPLDQPIFVEPGTRKIVLRKPTYHDDHRTIEAQVGSPIHLVMTLYPFESRSASSFSDETPAADSPRTPSDGEGRDAKRTGRTIFAVGAGVGVTGFGIGLSLGIASILERAGEAKTAGRLALEHGTLACTTPKLPGCKEVKATSDRADVLAVTSVVSLCCGRSRGGDGGVRAYPAEPECGRACG